MNPSGTVEEDLSKYFHGNYVHEFFEILCGNRLSQRLNLFGTVICKEKAAEESIAFQEIGESVR